MNPVVHVNLDGDGVFPELKGRKIHRITEMTVTSLPGGMTSGLPSVAVRMDLPGTEESVFFETSVRMWLSVADLLKSKYGDPRK